MMKLSADYKAGLEAAAAYASRFTTRPDASIHPDITWDQMNPEAQMVAHTTAQQIAWGIRDLKDGIDSVPSKDLREIKEKR
jgi:hypothetical protein